MIELGWTRDQVLDQIDVPFLEDLKGVWDRLPPMRAMLASLAGIKPKDRPSRDYASLAAMFPSGVMK